MWSIVLGACSPDEDQLPDDGTTDTVTCKVQADNALRVDCVIALQSEATITLPATDPDGDVVTVDSPIAAEATLTLWGLRPTRRTTWSSRPMTAASPPTSPPDHGRCPTAERRGRTRRRGLGSPRIVPFTLL